MNTASTTSVSENSGSHESNSTEDLRSRVRKYDWVHQIDLGRGVVTPGRWPPHPLITQAFDSINFQGKKVLDIGTWDGLWAFEAEKRGAREVWATDYITQRSYNEQPTFLLAHEVLNSNVNYHPKVNVFDIDKLGEADFDIVVFCGVYYHLRDPLKALAKLRQVTAEGGTIIVEGDVILGTGENYAKFHYRDWHLGDPSNWWVPTQRCLEEWVDSSYFEIRDTFLFPYRESVMSRMKKPIKRLLGRDTTRISRAVVTATAVSRADKNYCFPDADFVKCDRNTYPAV